MGSMLRACCTFNTISALDDPSDYADAEIRLQNAPTWEWMHPLDEVMGSLRAAGLAIDEFTEHYRVPWQIFPSPSRRARACSAGRPSAGRHCRTRSWRRRLNALSRTLGVLPRLDGGCHAC
jgi:hypothetical protein